MKLEDINKCLVELASQADELGYRELSIRLMNLSRSYYSPYRKLKSVKEPYASEPSGPGPSFIEFREDGPYLNGARVDGITGMSIDSKVGDFTKVDLKLLAKVHGLDDIKTEYSF